MVYVFRWFVLWVDSKFLMHILGRAWEGWDLPLGHGICLLEMLGNALRETEVSSGIAISEDMESFY
jgi:hypothetical protein